jgi:hypothetical protein
VSGTFGIANSPDNKVSIAVSSPRNTGKIEEARMIAQSLQPAK